MQLLHEKLFPPSLFENSRDEIAWGEENGTPLIPVVSFDLRNEPLQINSIPNETYWIPFHSKFWPAGAARIIARDRQMDDNVYICIKSIVVIRDGKKLFFKRTKYNSSKERSSPRKSS